MFETILALLEYIEYECVMHRIPW